jgi:imidazolonepropionase-like amidohydrolase
VLLTLLALAAAVAAQDTASRTVLRAATVVDGRGGVQHNVDILVVGSRIARIGPRGAVPAGARLVDLGDRTVLPVDGDPLRDITALRRVSFVMQAGRVVRDDGTMRN